MIWGEWLGPWVEDSTHFGVPWSKKEWKLRMGWPQVARRNLFQCIVDTTSISQERQRVVSILILLKVHIDIGVCVKICVLLMYVHNTCSPSHTSSKGFFSIFGP